MYILSCETALGIASVAVIKDGEVVSRRNVTEKNEQAEKLFSITEDALKEAGISYSDIDLFAPSVGPGSFTGIRIGLSGYRAAAFASGKICKGASTLEALAIVGAEKFENGEFVSVINAGRDEAYAQKFECYNGEIIKIYEPKICSLTELEADLRKIGNVSNEVAEGFCDVFYIPTAVEIGKFAFISNKYKKGEYKMEFVGIGSNDFDRTLPLYIRKPDAVKNKNIRKVI